MSNESLIEECMKLDRVSALRLYRARVGCSLKEAADTLFPSKKAPLTFPEPVTWLIERSAFRASPDGQDAESNEWLEEAHEPGETGSFPVYTEQQVRAMFAERGIK